MSKRDNSKTPGRTAPKKQKPHVEGLATLQELLKHLQVTEWDALIVGDGSGSGWKQGAGWSAVLIDKYSGARKLFYGALNAGTVTLGELLPYLHALSWYTATDAPGHRRRKEASLLGKQMHIHIVTDSQIIATSGNNPESRRSHRELWKAFDEYVRRGFILKFHYVPRDTVNLNVLVDEVSRQARLDIEDTYGRAVKKLCARYPGLSEDVSIYDFSN
jgi:hypothetical protein